MAVRENAGKMITLVVLLLAVAGILYAVIDLQSPASEAQLKIGEPAPDFTLLDLDGKQVSLSDYRGKVVLLNFWATWCTPCRAEMPDLQRTYDNLKDQGFVVLGVNIGERQVTAKGFARSLGITFPIVLDQDKVVTLEKYKVGPIPSSYFIDREGIIRHQFLGSMNESFITSEVQKLLSNSAP